MQIAVTVPGYYSCYTCERYKVKKWTEVKRIRATRAGIRGKCGKGWSFVKERTVTHTKCLSQNWCLSSFLTVSSSCYVINEINASWNQHLVFFRHASIVEKCLVLTNYTLSTNSKHTSLKYQLSLLMEAKQAQNG